MLEKINHYSLENHPTIYDEESMTVLELVARLASLINSTVDYINVDLKEDMDTLRASISKAIESWLSDHPEDYTTINDYLTPEMFGGVSDGVTDSTDALRVAVFGGNVNLHGGTFVLSSGLTLDHVIRNGTIIYKGPYTSNIFNMVDGGGLQDVNLIIKTPNFAGNVVMADYTPYDAQFNPMQFLIDGLYIDNTITTGFVDPSTCVRIRYDKYKVITGQNLRNLRLEGYMEYGIYIEPILRNTSDNPVFNTAVFENVRFTSANCALKILPQLAEGDLEDAQGGIGLLLHQFTNQHNDLITKSFMDVHNASIEGDMIIPWDYYGDQIPEEGIYKTSGVSKILLTKDYFNDNSTVNTVRYPWTNRSTGEAFSNLYCTKLENVGDESPLRLGGASNWCVYNMKAIQYKPEKWNKYKNTYTGLQFQRSGVDDPNGNKTVQIGTDGDRFYYRVFNKTTGWGKHQWLYGDNSVPQMYSGKRSAGVRKGDMMYDTTKNMPMWWNGTAWQSADGTVTVAVDYTEPEYYD